MRRPKTTAVGIVRDSVSLSVRLGRLGFKAIGSGLALAHNGLDSLATISKTAVDDTKKGYSAKRSTSKDEPVQAELDLQERTNA